MKFPNSMEDSDGEDDYLEDSTETKAMHDRLVDHYNRESTLCLFY